MSSGLTLFIEIVVASLIGTVLHETAHAAVALALGKFHAFQLWQWEVHWRYAGGTLGDYSVAAAPVVIGVLALPIVIHTIGLPPLWFWIGWGWFTFVGALGGDFRFETVEEDADGQAAI